VDEGWERVVAGLGPRLHRLAFLLVGDVTEAEDIVAEAMVRCVPKLRRGSVSDPAGYLVRAVVNTANNRRRRLALERRVRSRKSGDDRGLTTVDEAVASRLTMVRALGGLPPRQRAVLVLRYYEDLTEVQIADALDVSVGSVKTHASRGLAALRLSLGDPEASPR
jgi:RNA polymerase sigma-70 factor (sigma-E family)